MTLKPIKLRLGGEEIHLVRSRDLGRWGGFLHARRGAWELMTPENIAEIRHALLCPCSLDTEGVYTELWKQLEDGRALFFEVPPEPVPFDSEAEVDIHDLLPDGRRDDNEHRPDADGRLHWVEVICVSPTGESFAGAKARIRLPDGRSEHVTLDSNSSVRFDDITEGGTAHFELSGDARARGPLRSPLGVRYELGAAIGLPTQRQHMLVVHPNPRAFVSVELLLEADPVTIGNYTLSTQLGDHSGTLEGEAARVDGFALPSSATYSFEGVVPPPRPAEHDDPFAPAPMGEDPISHEPGRDPVDADGVRIELRLDDGSPITGTIRIVHTKTEDAKGDEAEFSGISGPAHVHVADLRLEPEDPTDSAPD